MEASKESVIIGALKARLEAQRAILVYLESYFDSSRMSFFVPLHRAIMRPIYQELRRIDLEIHNL